MVYRSLRSLAVAWSLPLVLIGCAGDDGGAADANATESSTAGTVGGGGTVSGGQAETGPTSSASPTGTGDSADTTNPPPTTGGGPMACCSEHPTPGCTPFSVSKCVCDERPFCCQFEWDASCVDVATNSCGGCGPVEDSGASTGAAGEGDCCEANGSPGCNDPGIQSCTCSEEAQCCDNEWTNNCANIADSLCGAGCPMGTDTGMMSGSGSTGGSGSGSGTGGGSSSGSGSSSGTAG